MSPVSKRRKPASASRSRRGPAARPSTRRAPALDVVFVADSSADQQDANRQSWQNLVANLHAFALDRVPIVVQYNKRDLPNAAPLEELNRVLNTRGMPWVEAAAKSGKGVEETLKVATQLVFKVLATAARRSSAGETSALYQPGA